MAKKRKTASKSSRNSKLRAKTRNSRDRVLIGDGPPCSRCLMTTSAWKHSAEWVPTPGKGHYAFWYQCQNDACITHQIMPPEAFEPAKRQKP